MSAIAGTPAFASVWLKLVTRDEFASLWDNGVLFIIKNSPEIGRRHFNRTDEWSLLARAPLGTALAADSLARLTVGLPGLGEF